MKTNIVLTFVPLKYNFEVVLTIKKGTKHSIKMSGDFSFFKKVTVPIFNQASQRDDWAKYSSPFVFWNIPTAENNNLKYSK